MDCTKKKIAKYIIKNIMFFLVIYLAYLFEIRLCLMYNIFKIPCPGCGLTRALIELLKGNLIESLRYNFLLIPLIIIYVLYSYIYIIGLFKEKVYLKNILIKYKKFIVISCIILMVVVEIININNTKLF